MNTKRTFLDRFFAENTTIIKGHYLAKDVGKYSVLRQTPTGVEVDGVALVLKDGKWSRPEGKPAPKEIPDLMIFHDGTITVIPPTRSRSRSPMSRNYENVQHSNNEE